MSGMSRPHLKEILFAIAFGFFFSCSSTQPKTDAALTKEKAPMDIDLAKAIDQENIDQIKILITNGADVNTISERGDSTLSLGVFSKKPELIAFALQKGANVNALSKGGEPLGLVIAEFVAHNELPYETLVIASESGAELDGTLGRGATTPLHNAAKQCNLKVAQLLISRKVYLEPTDKFTNATPLHLAAQKGCLPIVKLLIENGVDMNPRDENGRTPLDSAKSEKRWAVAKYLKSRGAI